MPLASPNDIVRWTRRQSLFMLHSTAHWQKTIHGYSGLQPALHDALYLELLKFPADSVLARLASLGVTYVVVHSDLYRPEEWHDVDDCLARSAAWLTLRYGDATGRVYSLQQRPDAR